MTDVKNATYEIKNANGEGKTRYITQCWPRIIQTLLQILFSSAKLFVDCAMIGEYDRSTGCCRQETF